MHSRETRSIVAFTHPFRIAGYDDELPAGEYELVSDEELLEGLSFEAYRRTASYLLIGGRAGRGGAAEMRQIDPRDLEAALARDRASTEKRGPGEAAPLRLGDLS